MSYNYEINQKFNLPLLKGDLNINNKNLTINLSETESSETKLNLIGTANLDDSFNYLDCPISVVKVLFLKKCSVDDFEWVGQPLLS